MQTSTQDKYIKIVIGQETYAIRIFDIHEIIRMQDITKLPKTSSHVKGIINLRGKIIPVVSLRILRGLSDIEYTKSTRIVVISKDQNMVGIIVDQANEVINFSKIEPPTEKSKFVTGIGFLKNDLVGILNLDNFMV